MRKQPSIQDTVREASAKPLMVALARRVAEKRTDNPLHDGRVRVDIFGIFFDLLARELPGTMDALFARANVEARAGAAILVATGVLVKRGRGKTAYHVLAQGWPTSEVMADVLHAELRASGRSEALFTELEKRSPGLALLGLEGERAWGALYRMCVTPDVGFRLDYLCGSERALDQRPVAQVA